MVCLMHLGKGWATQNILAHDEYIDTPTHAVPTITAGGDFLLPTYMLPQDTDLLVALNEKEKKQSLNLVVEEHEALPKVQNEKKAVSYTLADEKDSPKVIKQIGEGAKKKEFTSKEKVRVKPQKETVDDVLKKQQGLMQQVPQSRVVITTEPKKEENETKVSLKPTKTEKRFNSVAKKQEVTEDKLLGQQASSFYEDKEETFEEITEKTMEIKKEKRTPKIKKSLLLPLSREIEEESAEEVEELKRDDPPMRYVVPSRYADTILGLAGRRQVSSSFVMPKEIKVSFYPNNYALSGQAMKWIKAFSLGAIQDPSVVIDLRMSSKNPNLQEKRLKLIKQVLIQNGLSRHQLKVSWTSRGENSVMLRYVERIDDEEIVFRRGPRREKM